MNPGRPKVLVADQIESEQLAPLRDAGVDVVDRAGISIAELMEILPGFQGLLVRSRTKVTSEILARGAELRVIGRAGTGVDNVDLDAATRLGIVVMNVPGGNVVAAAEQTLALLFALARNTTAANAGVRAGKWEQKPYLGIELTGRTLGVIGLGRIGREVAARARGLRMRVLGFDPIVSSGAAEAMQVEWRSLDDLAREADVITLHVPFAPLTNHLVDRRLISLMKPGVRILNVARGGIIDETALLEALESGHVGGAGLDVFEKEPPGASALVLHPRVVATPHLGASTAEAQATVARQIGIQVGRYLTLGIVENAVNLVGLDERQRDTLAPWARLARQMGRIAQALVGPGLRRVELTVAGEAAALPREALTVEALSGLLRPHAGERINQVNAAHFAKSRGISVAERSEESHPSFNALLRLSVSSDQEEVELDGTLFGRQELRIVRAFGVDIDASPEGVLIFVMNEDRPGMIGLLGTEFSRAGVNIANMSVGRDRARGSALMVLNLDQEPPASALDAIRAAPGIRSVRAIPSAASST